MAIEKTPLMEKLSESLMMTMRKDMEDHPDRFRAEIPPTKNDIVLYLQQQPDQPQDTQQYKMKMAESIRQRLRGNRHLID